MAGVKTRLLAQPLAPLNHACYTATRENAKKLRVFFKVENDLDDDDDAMFVPRQDKVAFSNFLAVSGVARVLPGMMYRPTTPFFSRAAKYSGWLK